MVSQVARCTKIINPNTDDAKYMINVKQIAKFVVGLGDRVAPADIEEGMRVGVDRNKYQIQIPLPPKIDPTVTMMTVEEKPDITYNDIGGNKEEIQKLREVLELPMLHPERFVQLGIDPPKGILLFGPPGKLCSRQSDIVLWGRAWACPEMRGLAAGANVSVGPRAHKMLPACRASAHERPWTATHERL
jgi:ATP-dependent 26S proteasome regulatory subunit